VKRVRPSGRDTRRRGFTLVELVTSASLMTVMMLGVVQVFAIITQTASEAEGVHFAQQQLRALLNRLHNDLRGMTREGYLKITSAKGNDPSVVASPQYSRDTLAFVTIGRCASIFGNQPYEGTASEVVYTNNVRTPSQVLYVKSSSRTTRVSARRGILGRGQWMMSGEASGTAHDLQDTSAASYLCEMFQNQNQQVAGTKQDRISRQGTHLAVYPWTAVGGLPDQHAETLKRVMASCVSEFYVETIDPNASGSSGPVNPSGSGYFRPISGTYTWSRKAGFSDPIKTWPRAIRVTVVVHDPSDNAPPEKYSDGTTVKPFRGFALQEVFWLTDP
jgi:type II secretory pathway component PulJ